MLEHAISMSLVELLWTLDLPFEECERIVGLLSIVKDALVLKVFRLKLALNDL